MDIDRDRWSGAQRRLLKDATSTSLRIEDNFRKLGVKSSAEMDLMRRKITNSFNMIKNSSQATANDIVRAEKAKNAQLKTLNEQQFGHQTSLLSKLKTNWLATSAAIVASIYAIRRVTSIIDEFIDEASDLGETISKTKIIFKEHAQEMLDWADTAAASMGMSKQSALETASTLGNMFDQLGAGRKIAAELSQEMVELAVDIASLHNVAGGAESVMVAMMSAFRGEYDALQRYIPTIKAATVATEAMRMTGKKTASELTELEKAFAAQQIIIKGAGVAVGDFGRTSGELANQERILAANIKDLKAAIGTYLLPAVTDIVFQMNEWIAANKGLIEQRVHESIDKMTTAVKSMVGVYNSLPEGVVGAAGYGIVGRIFFGKGVGGLIAVLKLLEPHYEKLPQLVKDITTMLGGGIPDSFFEETPGAPIFRGKIPPRPENIIPDMSAVTGGSTQAGMNTAMLRYEEQAALMMAKSEETLAAKTDMETFMEANLTDALYDMRQKRLEDQTGFAQKSLELDQWQHDAAILIAQQEAEEIDRIEKRKRMIQATTVQNAIENAEFALKYFGEQSKIAFEAFKVISIAETIVNTYKAAVGAYSAMASIPFVGPALGAAAAAAAIAYGMAQVSAIRSMQPGGGGGGGGTPAVATYPASPITGFPEREEEKRGTLTINIQGDVIGDEAYIEMLAEKISEAVEDRDVILVSSNAKYSENAF